MSNIVKLPSAKYLQACFNYSPKTGNLRWKVRPRNHFPDEHTWSMWNTKFANTNAGYIRKGYLRVGLYYRHYAVHRIIWKWMTGKEPFRSIDHKDGNPFNNRWGNLRDASHQEQMWNSRFQKNNTSGYRGVWPYSSKWRAAISGKHLGTFSTPQKAAAAYRAAARKMHGEFHRDGK